jgi:hypothetical protein
VATSPSARLHSRGSPIPPRRILCAAQEGCRSGRTGRSRKPLGVQASRGFKSLPLRSLFKPFPRQGSLGLGGYKICKTAECQWKTAQLSQESGAFRAFSVTHWRTTGEREDRFGRAARSLLRQVQGASQVRIPVGGAGGSATTRGGAAGSACNVAASSTKRQSTSPSGRAALGASNPGHPSLQSVSPTS